MVQSNLHKLFLLLVLSALFLFMFIALLYFLQKKPPEAFYKKGAVIISAKFTEKHHLSLF